MRRLLISLIIIVSSVNAQGGRFTINGQISNLRGTAYVGFSYLKMRDGLWDKVSVDSISVHDGKFSVAGDVDELTAATILYGHHKYRIYVEPCVMSVIIDASKPYSIQQAGTSIDSEIRVFRQFVLQNDSILYMAYEDYLSHPYELRQGRELYSYYIDACNERLELLMQYTEAHPQSPLGPDLLLQALMLGKQDIDDIVRKRALLTDSMRTSSMGQVVCKVLHYVKSATAHICFFIVIQHFSFI